MLEKRQQNLTHLTDQTKEITSCVDRLDLNRYSSYSRLIYVIGWVWRFVTNCRSVQELRERNNVFASNELTNAENFWVRQAQAEAFPQGEKEKVLLQLSPQADSNGILRANGRLKYADDLPFDARHPILLPKHHPLTELIIKSEHQKLGHGTGVEHLLRELRTRFWIPKGRKAIRRNHGILPWMSSTIHCEASPTNHGSSTARVKQSLRAFEQIGVDFGRPYLTKQGRGKCRAKRYICLFTCLTARTVHLEMASGLDTDSFMNAFVRMTARRGAPRYVVSDNGTNFVGAERELRQLVDDFNCDRIVKATNKQYRIEWKFNPPEAPNFGGVFEAMIKAAKRALRSILGNVDVADEELHTAICGAESLLNSRPITYVSADDDLTPLTPNHFLC